MKKHHWHCKVCGELTDNRVCWDCYNKSLLPCVKCGKPTPSITRMGKTGNFLCISCYSASSAITRTKGKTCSVCGIKSASIDGFYQLCDHCKSIEVPCPACHNPMPKYRKRGALRKTCSNRCTKLMHPTTSEQSKKAHKKRWMSHTYKSPANKRARVTNEYRDWRKAVYERDNYTCQECGCRGGELHPHHIKPFATYIELRYEVSNGITLCASCHRNHHKHAFSGRKPKSKKPIGQLKIPTAE